MLLFWAQLFRKPHPKCWYRPQTCCIIWTTSTLDPQDVRTFLNIAGLVFFDSPTFPTMSLQVACPLAIWV